MHRFSHKDGVVDTDFFFNNGMVHTDFSCKHGGLHKDFSHKDGVVHTDFLTMMVWCTHIVLRKMVWCTQIFLAKMVGFTQILHDFSIKLVLHTDFSHKDSVVHRDSSYKVDVVHPDFSCKDGVGCLAIPQIWLHLAGACGPQTCFRHWCQMAPGRNTWPSTKHMWEVPLAKTRLKNELLRITLFHPNISTKPICCLQNTRSRLPGAFTKKNNLFGLVGGLDPPIFVEEISRRIYMPS